MNRTTMGIMTALAAAAVLTGCSGGGPDWPTTGGASSTAAAPPSGETSVPSSPAAGTTGGSGSGTGTGTGGGGAAGGGGGGQSSRCTTGELRGSLGPADGAAGSVDQTLVLTNTGSRTCTLRGFPGVSYVQGDDGRQAGPSAVMVGARGGDVTLAPGRSAGADMQLANVQNFDAGSCRPVEVRGLRVYPPGDTASLFVARPGTGCSQAPSGGNQLSVQTVHAL